MGKKKRVEYDDAGHGRVDRWIFVRMDVNAMGIRKSLLLCFAVCSVLSFVLFKTNDSFSVVIYAEIVILALFFGASQGVLSVCIPDLFPVSVRGTATGFVSISAE